MHLVIDTRVTLTIDPDSHEAELIADDPEGLLVALRDNAEPKELIATIFGGTATDSEVSVELGDLQLYMGA